MRRAWAVVMALGACGCLAVFLRFQSGPWSAVPSFVPVAGVAGFLLYLLEIAYLIYLRGGPPPGARTRIGPGLCWGLTIVVVGAVGVIAGFAFNDAVRTYYGLLFLQTVTMALIAAGMVLSMTGGLWSVPSEMRAGAGPAVGRRRAQDDGEPFWRWIVRGAAFPVGAALTAAPLMLTMRALHEWVDGPRCRRLCEASGYTFDQLFEGKRYACMCMAPEGVRTFGSRPDFFGGHSWALLLAEDAGRMVLYLIAFAIPLAFFWLPWASRWGTSGPHFAIEKSPAPSDRVSAHAVEIMKREPAGTWVLVAEAHYLPHGGTDWIVLTLSAGGGGFLERRRAPERRPPMQVANSLSPETAQSIRAELAARGVTRMRDQLDPVIDGTHATFSFAVDGYVHSAELHGGGRGGRLSELLRFVADLAPLHERA